MGTEKYYLYPPDVRGIKFNGNEVKRLYVNGTLAFDADRIVFKVTTNSQARFGFNYYYSTDHYINVELKGIGSESNFFGYWRTTARGSGSFNYWYSHGSIKPNRDYILSIKVFPKRSQGTFKLKYNNGYSKLKAIYSWGEHPILSLASLFANLTTNVEELPNSLPNGCREIMDLFFGVRGRLPDNISRWDVSKVTNMQGTFYKCAMNGFSIKNWDVRSMQNGSYMFYLSDLNENLGNWRPRNATNLFRMMHSTYKNTSCDLRNWCIPSVPSDQKIHFAYGSPFAKTTTSSWRSRRTYYHLSSKLPKFGIRSC